MPDPPDEQYAHWNWSNNSGSELVSEFKEKRHGSTEKAVGRFYDWLKIKGKPRTNFSRVETPINNNTPSRHHLPQLSNDPRLQRKHPGMGVKDHANGARTTENTVEPVLVLRQAVQAAGALGTPRTHAYVWRKSCMSTIGQLTAPLEYRHPREALLMQRLLPELLPKVRYIGSYARRTHIIPF